MAPLGLIDPIVDFSKAERRPPVSICLWQSIDPFGTHTSKTYVVPYAVPLPYVAARVHYSCRSDLRSNPWGKLECYWPKGAGYCPFF